jgi:ribose transport system ATP-binding protein
MPDRAPALSVREVTKRYGAVTALDQVSFEVAPRTIHALVGANGSGKSTLIRILAGVEQAEPGGMLGVGPATVAADRTTPAFARAAGVRVVHQASTAFPDLTVAENIGVAGRLPTRIGGGIRWRQVHQETTALLERLGLDLAPRTRMGDLSPAVQTLVAVARTFADAEGDEAELLVLDEPTAALPSREVEVLLDGLRRLVDHGHAVVLVTHRLDEVSRVADSATVLRDGRDVATFAIGERDAGEIVALITGSVDAAARTAERVASDRPLLDVAGLEVDGVHDLSFTAREGEIVGIAGLLGSGRSTVLEALFGARTRRGGEVRFADEVLDLRSPARAMAAGVALVPEQRRRAVFADQSVAENLSIADLVPDGSRRLDRRRERRAAAADVAAFGIVTSGTEAPVATLSGGNQQKLVLARWLRRSPRLLLLDEPTLGVDVGARAEIHDLIRAYVSGERLEEMGGGSRPSFPPTTTATPRAALVVSSDVEELCALADRILVLHGGRLAHELPAADATPDLVNQLVHRGTAA